MFFLSSLAVFAIAYILRNRIDTKVLLYGFGGASLMWSIDVLNDGITWSIKEGIGAFLVVCMGLISWRILQHVQSIRN